MQQVQVVKHKSLDFVPAEFLNAELDKISWSLPNPLNQCMGIELKWCTVFHCVVVNPVNQHCILDDSGQRVVLRVVNVCGCL